MKKYLHIYENQIVNCVDTYDNYIDTDDNDYYIRKYSDDNIPIYNKRLTPSHDRVNATTYTHFYKYIKLILTLLFVLIPYIIYLYYVNQYH